MPGHSQRRTEKRFRLQMQSSWGNTPALTQMTFTGFWITSIQTLQLPFYGCEWHPDPTSLGYTKDLCTTRAWQVSCKIFKRLPGPMHLALTTKMQRIWTKNA